MTYEEFLSFGKPAGPLGELVFQLCPNCGDEKYHFYYNQSRELGNCKKCGYSPNKKRLLADLELSELGEDATLLDRIVSGLDELDQLDTSIENDTIEDLESTPNVIVDSTEDDELSMLIPLPLEVQPVYNFSAPVRYLLRRGVSRKDMMDLELQYCTEGKYAKRIILPVRNVGGTLVGFTSRSILKDAHVKYMTPSNFRISHYLYGEDLLREEEDNLVIVEGPFDRFRARQADLAAVATFGKSLSTKQMETLYRLRPKEVTLMWDADAHNEIIRAAAVLSHAFPVRVVLLEEGDPGSTGIRKLAHLIRNTPLFRSMEWAVRGVEDESNSS